VDDELTMGTLVRACEACRDAAIAYGIPFISGKDSLHNQFTNRETGQVIRIPRTLLISAIGVIEDVRKCVTMDLKSPGNRLALVESPDSADPVAAAEMAIASGHGLSLNESFLGTEAAFAETSGRYLIELPRSVNGDVIERELRGTAGVSILGIIQPTRTIKIASVEISLDELTTAWRGTLDW
jgi:phosphoribosylformylglycinamidine (FGAM) synthase-like enzyme